MASEDDQNRSTAGSISPLDRHVARRLQALRIERGLTKPGLAEACQMDPRQYRKIEAGRTKLSAGWLYELARVLRVPPTAFFAGLDIVAQAGQRDKFLRLYQDYLGLDEADQLAIERMMKAMAKRAGRKIDDDGDQE